ncbi:MAG: carboxypeptidase-like regulatory domain-containing protein [Bacteroidetes bacterium]|nr:carboxypeptidase-like regulatory domain-containing protein [Bacteroidota bacterium]
MVHYLRYIVLFAFILLFKVKHVHGQDEKNVFIESVIIDASTQEVLPGANIILQSDILTGATTNAQGKFLLTITKTQQKSDSVIISFIGYDDLIISLQSLTGKESIGLKPRATVLKEATVTAKRIIAEEFTIKQMKQLDIYLNPLSQADPLLAVNSMPASTTTDESASISLRGSSPTETGIFFNNVPVYDAVRFSQLNGIGTFSIFNTAIVERMHVFPSNPPLEYGNTSSGLIAIQSHNEIPQTKTRTISLSLANIGLQYTGKFSPKTGFSVFSNYQPSAALIGTNEKAFDNLENFYAADLGLHGLHKFNDSSVVKIFSYTNLEGYKFKFNHASFNGTFDQSKKRNFTIANYIRDFRHSEFSINAGMSFSNEEYGYGNTAINIDKQDLYANINYQYFFEKLSFKTGVSTDSRTQKLDGKFPVFYYALSEIHPSVDYTESKSVTLTEAYLYSKYELNKHWVAGFGLRKNIPTKTQKDFLSMQGNIHYSFLKHHSINASFGRYHRYALPNADIATKTFYRSDQVSLDYSLETGITELTAAVFAKKVSFGSINEDVQGAEIYMKLYLFENKVTFQNSYTFINAGRKNDSLQYPGKYDLDYFFRTSLKYQHRSYLDISLIMLYRQGTYYRPVTGSDYIGELDVYEPLFTGQDHMIRYPGYMKLDLSISKMWILSPKTNIITFMNISNILNKKNVRDLTYNADYSSFNYDYYSKRTLYFGGIINF